MEAEELMVVYTTDNANTAELMRMALHNEGLKCEIDGESQAGLTGLSTMEIKLLVRAIDYDRARAYIEQHEPK